jgi:hypothetical protein
MKKVKFNFEGGLKGFFLYHVEKCVLGVIAALVGYMIISGASARRVLDPSLTVQSLEQSIASANNTLSSSNWATVLPERRPANEQLDDVSKRVPIIAADNFNSKGELDPSSIQPNRLRSAPKLLAAEHVRVIPFVGPMAFAVRDAATGPVTGDKLAPYPVTLRGLGGGVYGGVEDRGPVPTEAAPPAGAAPKRPRRDRDNKADPYGLSDAGPGPGRPPGTVGGAAATPATPGQRVIPPEALQGLRPREARVRLHAAQAMVITASVPFSNQWKNFEEAFKYSPGGQSSKRDIPLYQGVWVERADVTDAPNETDPAKLKWEKLETKKLKTLEAQYAVIASEICEPATIDPVLAHIVPPILLTDMKQALTHPDVPVKKAPEIVKPKVEGPNLTEAATEEGKSSVDLPDSVGPAVTPGASELEPGRVPGQAIPPPDYGPGVAGEGMGYAPGYAPGANSYDSGPGSDLSSYKPPERKLVRFVDYFAKPGRLYRYRVQLVLLNPNFPKSAAEAPEFTSLDDKTRETVKALEAQSTKDKFRTYWLTTPFSEISDAVTLPQLDKFYAAETMLQKPITLRDVKMPFGEPTVRLMSVIWDKNLVAFVPSIRTALRGTVMSGIGESEVLHPALGDVRMIKDYNLNSEAIVLDIGGGELLPGADPLSKDPSDRAPGRSLVLDKNGKLLVNEETTDVEGYRRYYFPEVKNSPATGVLDSGAPPGEFGLENPYAPPGEGPAPRPRNR